VNSPLARVAPILGVRSVRQAAEYYRDVLGFCLDPVDGVFQPSPDDPDGVYGIVKRGEVWIHFQIRRDSIPIRDRHPFERDVYLYVNNISAMYADLIARGASVVHPLADTPYGIREFTVEDLNGFRLTYGQIL
jgi:uncharacterized glyoxalase superfamily protein PhnB